MCLINFPEDVEKFQEKHKDKKTVTVWKVIQIHCGDHPQSTIKDHIWNPGLNESSASTAILAESECEVNHGFHVWLNKPDYSNHCQFPSERIMELHCAIEDLLGVGYQHGGGYLSYYKQAVFRKATLTQEEHDRVLASPRG